ncbi:MAG: hypothetical protein OEZ21_01745 [Candidatus Bathyarchaeota archaeon]|nr:hypothetical protein [Candidatus Bathyarchaeota archaeon]MDH5745668.1 hypothetical protein [Candidatus Bathyarchaeota archaeon]
MSTQSSPKRLVFRWTTLKGIAAIILFIIIAALIEYFVVFYAVNLGVKDESLLQWNFQFPGTDWITTIIVSPLFHLVPIAVIITLVSSWSYLTKYVAVKPPKTLKGKSRPTKRGKKRGLREARKLASKISHTVKNFFDKIRSGLSRVKGVVYPWQETRFARATIKSASTVLLVFAVFILLVSLLAYPQLIYRTISSAYQNNPSLLNFTKSTSNSVKGIADALAPIGWICSSINNALLSATPGFRDFALSLGVLIKPLTDLDNAGKYLVFQNMAAWVSALSALFYGEYMGKSYRYKKKKRS